MNNPFLKKTEINGIKNIIVVASGKGGVGKSTIAAGIALSLAKEGYATGLLDADIYGPSIPVLFNTGTDKPHGVEIEGKQKIVPLERLGLKIMSVGFFIDPKQALQWRGPIASNTLKQLMEETLWGNLDYLIIDTPPGTGDIHLTILQTYNINGVFIVTTPQLMAQSDVQKAISMFSGQEIGAPILGIIENMSWFSPIAKPEERYELFGKGGGKALAEEFNIPLIAQVPITENTCQLCDQGKVHEILNVPSIKLAFQSINQCIASSLLVNTN